MTALSRMTIYGTMRLADTVALDETVNCVAVAENSYGELTSFTEVT